MSCDETSLDMDESQEGACAIGSTTEGIKEHPGGAVELQMQMEFGLEVMQQRAKQIENLPSLGVEDQLPVEPLP